MTRLLYFSSQQLINPSTSEMATRTYASVLCTKSAFDFLQATRE
jgi:hypothetical protein